MLKKYIPVCLFDIPPFLSITCDNRFGEAFIEGWTTLKCIFKGIWISADFFSYTFKQG